MYQTYQNLLEWPSSGPLQETSALGMTGLDNPQDRTTAPKASDRLRGGLKHGYCILLQGIADALVGMIDVVIAANLGLLLDHSHSCRGIDRTRGHATLPQPFPKSSPDLSIQAHVQCPYSRN